jgi:serine/threonine protein phosphatase PrpC
MVENSRSFGINSELGERIAKEIQEKLPNKSFCVCALGDSDKRIIVSAAHSRELVDNCDTLRRIVSRVCGFATRALPAYEDENGAYMMIVRDCVLRAHVSGKCRGASGEGGVCGDSFGTLNAPDGRHTYAYISDGMGSGAAAARTSEICSLFLQNLLPANFGSSNVDSTLELLNSFLCAQNGTGRAECSSTVDLCCLDLLDCRAQFFKCGAAPTYVFRDGSLFKIHSRTVPIGIIKQPDIGRVSMDLLPGDVIVLVSDGVTEGREECPELFEYLRSRLLTHDSDDLADAIMKYAEEQGCEDDVSAVVIKITERPLSDFLCDE